ncbi:hypothetical protein KM043_016265 [Ampulex compressa]|nr:hypothetical protein KM043_016265 [Ampulex compressa]
MGCSQFKPQDANVVHVNGVERPDEYVSATRYSDSGVLPRTKRKSANSDVRRLDYRWKARLVTGSDDPDTRGYLKESRDQRSQTESTLCMNVEDTSRNSGVDVCERPGDFNIGKIWSQVHGACKHAIKLAVSNFNHIVKEARRPKSFPDDSKETDSAAAFLRDCEVEQKNRCRQWDSVPAKKMLFETSCIDHYRKKDCRSFSRSRNQDQSFIFAGYPTTCTSRNNGRCRNIREQTALAGGWYFDPLEGGSQEDVGARSPSRGPFKDLDYLKYPQTRKRGGSDGNNDSPKRKRNNSNSIRRVGTADNSASDRNRGYVPGKSAGQRRRSIEKRNVARNSFNRDTSDFRDGREVGCVTGRDCSAEAYIDVCAQTSPIPDDLDPNDVSPSEITVVEDARPGFGAGANPDFYTANRPVFAANNPGGMSKWATSSPLEMESAEEDISFDLGGTRHWVRPAKSNGPSVSPRTNSRPLERGGQASTSLNTEAFKTLASNSGAGSSTREVDGQSVGRTIPRPSTRKDSRTFREFFPPLPTDRGARCKTIQRYQIICVDNRMREVASQVGESCFCGPLRLRNGDKSRDEENGEFRLSPIESDEEREKIYTRDKPSAKVSRRIVDGDSAVSPALDSKTDAAVLESLPRRKDDAPPEEKHTLVESHKRTTPSTIDRPIEIDRHITEENARRSTVPASDAEASTIKESAGVSQVGMDTEYLEKNVSSIVDRYEETSTSNEPSSTIPTLDDEKTLLESDQSTITNGHQETENATLETTPKSNVADDITKVDQSLDAEAREDGKVTSPIETATQLRGAHLVPKHTLECKDSRIQVNVEMQTSNTILTKILSEYEVGNKRRRIIMSIKVQDDSDFEESENSEKRDTEMDRDANSSPDGAPMAGTNSVKFEESETVTVSRQLLAAKDIQVADDIHDEKGNVYKSKFYKSKTTEGTILESILINSETSNNVLDAETSRKKQKIPRSLMDDNAIAALSVKIEVGTGQKERTKIAWEAADGEGNRKAEDTGNEKATIVIQSKPMSKPIKEGTRRVRSRTRMTVTDAYSATATADSNGAEIIDCERKCEDSDTRMTERFGINDKGQGNENNRFTTVNGRNNGCEYRDAITDENNDNVPISGGNEKESVNEIEMLLVYDINGYTWSSTMGECKNIRFTLRQERDEDTMTLKDARNEESTIYLRDSALLRTASKETIEKKEETIAPEDDVKVLDRESRRSNLPSTINVSTETPKDTFTFLKDSKLLLHANDVGYIRGVCSRKSENVIDNFRENSTRKRTSEDLHDHSAEISSETILRVDSLIETCEKTCVNFVLSNFANFDDATGSNNRGKSNESMVFDDAEETEKPVAPTTFLTFSNSEKQTDMDTKFDTFPTKITENKNSPIAKQDIFRDTRQPKLAVSSSSKETRIKISNGGVTLKFSFENNTGTTEEKSSKISAQMTEESIDRSILKEQQDRTDLTSEISKPKMVSKETFVRGGAFDAAACSSNARTVDERRVTDDVISFPELYFSELPACQPDKNIRKTSRSSSQAEIDGRTNGTASIGPSIEKSYEEKSSNTVDNKTSVASQSNETMAASSNNITIETKSQFFERKIVNEKLMSTYDTEPLSYKSATKKFPSYRSIYQTDSAKGRSGLHQDPSKFEQNAFWCSRNLDLPVLSREETRWGQAEENLADEYAISGDPKGSRYCSKWRDLYESFRTNSMSACSRGFYEVSAANVSTNGLRVPSHRGTIHRFGGNNGVERHCASSENRRYNCVNHCDTHFLVKSPPSEDPSREEDETEGGSDYEDLIPLTRCLHRRKRLLIRAEAFLFYKKFRQGVEKVLRRVWKFTPTSLQGTSLCPGWPSWSACAAVVTARKFLANFLSPLEAVPKSQARGCIPRQHLDERSNARTVSGFNSHCPLGRKSRGSLLQSSSVADVQGTELNLDSGTRRQLGYTSGNGGRVSTGRAAISFELCSPEQDRDLEARLYANETPYAEQEFPLGHRQYRPRRAYPRLRGGGSGTYIVEKCDYPTARAPNRIHFADPNEEEQFCPEINPWTGLCEDCKADIEKSAKKSVHSSKSRWGFSRKSSKSRLSFLRDSFAKSDKASADAPVQHSSTSSQRQSPSTQRDRYAEVKGRCPCAGSAETNYIDSPKSDEGRRFDGGTRHDCKCKCHTCDNVRPVGGCGGQSCGRIYSCAGSGGGTCCFPRNTKRRSGPGCCGGEISGSGGCR